MDYNFAHNALYLEDFQVGRRFSSKTYAVDEVQIIEFARQFDPQPFHIDPAAARKSFFGGLVASGWHTAAMSMRLIVDSLPIAGGVIGVGGEAAWPQPTRPGDVLRVEGEVTFIRLSKSHPDRGIVTIVAKTLNQRNEIAQDLTAKLIVFRRPD